MSSTNFNDFMRLNRELLECYSFMDANQYLQLPRADQKDFCYVQRVRLEEQLIKGKVSVNDFRAAYRESL